MIEHIRPGTGRVHGCFSGGIYGKGGTLRDIHAQPLLDIHLDTGLEGARRIWIQTGREPDLPGHFWAYRILCTGDRLHQFYEPEYSPFAEPGQGG